MPEAVDLSIFENFPVLRSPRLVLRKLELSDAHALFAMRANALVHTFIARPLQQSEAESKALIEKTLNAYAHRQAIAWAAVLRGEGEVIGTCGFNRIELQHRRAEIGGEMSPDFWGKRLAQEAVRTIIEFGLGPMGLHSIEAKVDPGNRSAIAVLEAMGFLKEAHFREYYFYEGKFKDLAVFSLVKK